MSSANLFHYFEALPSSTVVAFVKQQKEMSERMKNAYQKIKEITNAEIRRMSEEEILNLSNTLLTKVSHIFILDNFSGSAYEHLMSKESKDLKIFGVPLLESINDVKITNFSRIYNSSFQDLMICTSNLNSTEKQKLENLVKLMNGQFTNILSSNVTHLVTNSTKTIKYSDAITLDIPVYHTEWINHIWNKWQKQDSILPKANSEQFESFKLPPLFDLKITTAGMSRERRNEISDLIEENGGKFEEIFVTNNTDILIMDKIDYENSKYRAAKKCKIPVLNTEWLNESIKVGYALAYDGFLYKHPRSQNSSSSSLSISGSNSEEQAIGEQSKGNKEAKKVEILKVCNVLTEKSNNEQFLSTYTIEQAKKLGHMLDGYVFYFYNFPTEYYFKTGKLISACGGIRITEIDQSISHILCFDQQNLEEFHKKTVEKEFHGTIVDYKWLVECFKQGKLLSEIDYIITLDSSSSRKIVPPSPLSRKAIHQLNSSITQCNEESKKENTKTTIRHSRKESGTSSKMLDFSNHCDDDFIQISIEESRKKLKQTPNVSVNRKRSHEDVKDLCSVDGTSKRRKTNSNEDLNNSFEV